MTGSNASSEATEQLLLQAGRVRALARSLLGDGDAALEAAHDAWIANGGRRAPGLWRTALKNRLRDLRRKRQRRTHHEQQAPARRFAEPTVEVAAQAELRRRLLDAVASLQEPLRTTIWLRFFEDQPPRAIARRTGVPVNTVRSRVRLGVEALRRSLDDLHDGDRRTWRRALAAAAGLPPLAVAVPVIGAVTMKKAAFAVVAVALALAIGVTAPRLFGTTPAAAPDTSVAQAAAPSAFEPGASQPANSPPPLRRPTTSATAAPPTAFTVRGDVELRMASDGTLAAAGDGWVRFYDNAGDAQYTFPIHGGSFTGELPGACTLDLSELRLDEWTIRYESLDWHCSADTARLTLPATAQPKGLLHVLDADNLTPLRDVDVARETYGELLPIGDPGFPGAAWAVWVEGAASPFPVPSDVFERTYHVSAPGHAWRSIALDHENGGEFVVVLEPGGDLEIVVDNLPTERAAGWLRVRDAHGDCIRERSLAPGVTRFARCPVGAFTVGVEFGDRDAPRAMRHTIATAAARITASHTTRVLLDCAAGTLAPPSAGPLRRLEGTVTAGAAWGKTYCQVLAIPHDRAPLQGEVARTASRRRPWPLGRAEAFTCDGLRPGRYQLVVTGFGTTRDVEIPPTGPVPAVELTLPDPVESTVCAFDGGSDAPIPLTSPNLMLRGPDGVWRFVVRGHYVDGYIGLLRSLPGDYRLRAWAGGKVEADVRTHAGAEHRITIQPRCGTLLEFRCGATRVPVAPEQVRLSHDDPAAEVLHLSDVGFRLSTHVSHAGRWRLQVAVPGYRPLDCEVEFREHEWQTTPVALERL